MKIITINSAKHGIKEIFVDDDDFGLVNQYKWHLLKIGNTFYAAHKTYTPNNGKRKVILMHRLLLNIIDNSLQGDHINHNGLDNRRANIRVATKSQNLRNRTAKKNGTSKYLGVSKYNKNRWRSTISIKGKPTTLGTFKSEILAAIYYDEAAKEFHGEFANLNFK